MNVERIWRHRGVILAALKTYEKRLEKLNKDEAELEVDSDDSEDKLAIVEELRAEFNPAAAAASGPGIEGTPMGDAIAGQIYRAEDGTALTVESLDAMLGQVGVDAPLDVVSAWTLEQRREAYTYVRDLTRLILDGREVDDIDPPAFVDRAWITKSSNGALLEREMTEEELERRIGAGPWGVHQADPRDPANAEWAIRRLDPADETGATYLEHPQMFGQLDRARLIAANLNEREATLAAAPATEEPTPEPEAQLEPEPAA